MRARCVGRLQVVRKLDWPRSEKHEQLPEMLALHRSQVASVQEFYRERNPFHAVSGVGGPYDVAGRLERIARAAGNLDHP